MRHVEDWTDLIVGMFLCIGLLILLPIVWLDEYLTERRNKL